MKTRLLPVANPFAVFRGELNMQPRQFENAVAAEVTRLKCIKNQSLLTWAATVLKQLQLRKRFPARFGFGFALFCLDFQKIKTFAPPSRRLASDIVMVRAGKQLKTFGATVAIKQTLAGSRTDDFVRTSNNDFHRAAINLQTLRRVEPIKQ